MKSLATYNPWGISSNLFEDFFGKGWETENSYDKALRVKTREEEDKFILLAEVPGLTDDQLHVEVKDGVLTVSANYEEKEEGDNFSALRRGRYTWESGIKGIDTDNITADLDAGILTISLPKVPEVQPKRIEIGKK